MRQDFRAESLEHALDLLKREIPLVGLPDKLIRVGGFDQQVHFATNISGGPNQSEMRLLQTIQGAFRRGQRLFVRILLFILGKTKCLGEPEVTKTLLPSDPDQSNIPCVLPRWPPRPDKRKT